jgi:uncharacterized membrane protein (DUF485 family)
MLAKISDILFYVLTFTLGMLVGVTSYWVIPFVIALIVYVMNTNTRLDNLEFHNKHHR